VDRPRAEVGTSGEQAMTIEATIKHARELFADGDNGPAKEAAFRAARAILLDYTKRQLFC